jgi:serine protease
VPGTTYFYRIAAFNGVGETYGENEIVFHAPMFNFGNIVNGEIVTNSMVRGERFFYRIKVPPGMTKLTVETMGRNGLSGEDIDMHIRGLIQPTSDVFDCASATKGVNEVCEVNNPAAGDWYIMITGYSWLKSTYRLKATLEGNGPGIIKY